MRTCRTTLGTTISLCWSRWVGSWRYIQLKLLFVVILFIASLRAVERLSTRALITRHVTKPMHRHVSVPWLRPLTNILSWPSNDRHEALSIDACYNTANRPSSKSKGGIKGLIVQVSLSCWLFRNSFSLLYSSNFSQTNLRRHWWVLMRIRPRTAKSCSWVIGLIK